MKQSICIILFSFIFFIPSLQAESFDTCVARCKGDVLYMSDCMDDEQEYWDIDLSKKHLRRVCLDLIRNERLYCIGECAKKEAKKNSPAVNFYDKHVRHFPETIE